MAVTASADRALPVICIVAVSWYRTRRTITSRHCRHLVFAMKTYRNIQSDSVVLYYESFEHFYDISCTLLFAKYPFYIE